MKSFKPSEHLGESFGSGDPIWTLFFSDPPASRRDDMHTLEATFRLRYTASDGKHNRFGVLVQGVRYTLTNGRWLISGIQTIGRVKE